MAVCRILWDQGERDIITLQAALLHDVLEESPLAALGLAYSVDKAVFDLVAVLSHKPGQSLREYYTEIKWVGLPAMTIKLADRLHNNSELHLLPPDSPVRKKATEKTELMKKIFDL